MDVKSISGLNAYSVASTTEAKDEERNRERREKKADPTLKKESTAHSENADAMSTNTETAIENSQIIGSEKVIALLEQSKRLITSKIHHRFIRKSPPVKVLPTEKINKVL